MKTIYILPILFFAPSIGFAQPMAVDCESAMSGHSQFVNASTEFIRKNAGTIVSQSFRQDVEEWLKNPMVNLNQAAVRNFSRWKTNDRRGCHLNFAQYQTLIERIELFSNRSGIRPSLWRNLKNVITVRTPASKKKIQRSVSVPGPKQLEKSLSSLRRNKRKIEVLTTALLERQSTICIERMKTEGDFRVLTDDEAAKTYSRYLIGFLKKGGTINEKVDHPFHNSEGVSLALNRQIDEAESRGEYHYAKNLLEVLQDSHEPRAYFARRSFEHCPVRPTAQLKILVPRSVTVIGIEPNKTRLTSNQFYFEDTRYWHPQQAVRYGNTQFDLLPTLIATSR